MKIFKLAWLGVVFFFVALQPTESGGQAKKDIVISGRVLNEFDNRPIRDVNVFIAGTMLGAATDSAGHFVIKGVPLGSHELVASRVGFAVKKVPLRLVVFRDRELEITLSPMVVQVPDLEVVSTKRDDWKSHLKNFRTFFLGTSKNATQCSITNPEVLEFVKDGSTDRFSAHATDILHVENRALGYRLFYLLEAFDLVEETIRYLGTTKFEELVPKNQEEGQRWQENRLKTYLGSLRHFLSTLAFGSTEGQGFEVSALTPTEENLYAPDLREVDLSRVVSPGALPFERQLHFFDLLQIIYDREMEDQEYIYWRMNNDKSVIGMTTQKRRESSRPQAQMSWILMNKTSATIDMTGYLYDPLAVTVYGYWAWENVADLLPIEYTPVASNSN